MKNKRGILLAETVLKIIIAALCIAVLVILAIKLFGMFSKENQVRKAEDNLNLIAEKIALLTSQAYTQDYLYAAIYPPKDKGWFIRSFERVNFPEKQCVGRFESCLCMCDVYECKNLKACKGFEKEIVIEGTETGSATVSSAMGSSPGVSVYTETIQFKAGIEELKISKQDNKIIISKSDRI